MHSRANYLRLMTLFVSSAAAVSIGAACGGKALSDSEASSGGASGGPTLGRPGTGSSGKPGSSGSTGSSGESYGPDCYPFQSKTFPVDHSKCEPQLATTMGCNDEVCQWTVDVPCAFGDGDAGAEDAGDGGVVAEGGTTEAEECAPCNAFAPPGRGSVGWCSKRTDDAGVRHLSCGGCGVGRPPRGFVAASVTGTSVEGARLAEMAQLEASSVFAFHALYTDLERHGAPADLLREVRDSATDEVRHARAMTRAAARHGAVVPEVAPLPARARSLEELAIENAEEGCVNETYGAALALVQAASATDLRFRAMMKRIADDEVRHAALSWHIAEWLDARLDDAARERVAQARANAIARLADALGSGSALPRIGLPSSEIARAVFDEMRPRLASGSLAA